MGSPPPASRARGGRWVSERIDNEEGLRMLDELRQEIRAMLAKPKVSYAEVLAVCLRYNRNEEWCNQLTASEFDEFMRIVGRIVTVGMGK